MNDLIQEIIEYKWLNMNINIIIKWMNVYEWLNLNDKWMNLYDWIWIIEYDLKEWRMKMMKCEIRVMKMIVL